MDPAAVVAEVLEDADAAQRAAAAGDFRAAVVHLLAVVASLATLVVVGFILAR